MAKKRNSKLPKNDFAPEEELEVCGFTSEPVITGDCISSFSFEEVNGYLFQKEHWHHEYASEAAIACKEYTFDKLNAKEVYSIFSIFHPFLIVNYINKHIL